MTFTEEWFSDDSCEVLAELVAEVAEIEGIIVEVGSWQGRSTIALANAAYPRTVHAVDTWQGSPGEISAELAAGRDVFAEFTSNIAAETKGNVTPHRMGWREFNEDNGRGGPVALLFIDAEHTFTEVRDNVLAFIDRVPPGGIICGDDVHHPPVRSALLSMFDIEFVMVAASVWIWRKP